MRDDKKREKRAAILKAATSVFSKEGFHKARIEDIAIAAGIGKGTLYQYFNSKQDLFKDMIKDGINSFVDKLKEDMQGETECEEVFKSILESSFSFMQKNVDISKLMIAHPISVDENLVRWIYDKKSEVIDIIANVIEKYIKLKEFKPVDSHIAAHEFFGMIISLMGDNVFRNKQYDVLEISEAAVKIYLYGLSAKKEICV